MQNQLVKKTIELNPKAIRKLRVIFQVNTDKEAVNRAIDLVAQEDEIIRTHKSLAGKSKLHPVFS